MNHTANFSVVQPKTAYSPVYSQNDFHNDFISVNLVSQQIPVPQRRFNWCTLQAVILRTLGYSSVLVVPLVLAIWLPRSLPDFQHSSIFQSVPLGGSLTLNQAKAVDFVSSAVFAPLILAIFNCAWFANARVSIANERTKRPQGTPLYSLVEASTISAGSYDLIKLWALVTSRSGSLMVFAILTLAAAMGKSSLSNVIAYEAYKRPVDAGPIQLRLLTGPYMTSYDVDQTTNNVSWLATHDQRKDFAQGTNEVLQGIAWQNSTSMLTSGSFVALNVTSYELGVLDSSIVELYNVPAINATIQCQAHRLSSLQVDSWSQTNNNGFTLRLDMLDTETNRLGNQTGWSVDVPAPFSVFQDTPGSSTTSLDILAYNDDGTSMFIGSMGGVTDGRQFDWTTNNTMPVPSPFGQIEARAFNVSMSNTCTPGTGCLTMLVWGMVCSVKQQQGFVNLTWTPESPNWSKNTSIWSSEVLVRPSKLKSLARELGTQSFKTGKAGLGPALTPSAETCNSSTLQASQSEICSLPGPRHLDYQTLADNLLWAEMAVQTVAFETGAMNVNLSTPDMFITVPSTASIQYYRMTYVPALLFGGLICVFVAAVTSASLLAYSTNTASGQQFRYVDSLRLLVDCAASIQDEKLPPDARNWSNQEILEWARNYMVRYEAYSGHNGSLRSSTVVVTPVTKHKTEGWPLSSEQLPYSRI